MIVVLDTNIYISAVLFPASKPGQILQAWQRRELELAVSPAILGEIKRVLSYPRIALHRDRFRTSAGGEPGPAQDFFRRRVTNRRGQVIEQCLAAMLKRHPEKGR